MSLFDALSISSSGMSAQRTRAEIVTQNLANAETTRTPEGGAYRRRDVVFESDEFSTFESHLSNQMSTPTGVRVADVVTDTRDPEKRYLPGHPDADKDGYVAFPHINPAEDMVDLMAHPVLIKLMSPPSPL